MDATWVTDQELRQNFPHFWLEEKSGSERRANVPVNGQEEEGNGQKKEGNSQQAKGLRRSNRETTTVTRFGDFIMGWLLEFIS